MGAEMEIFIDENDRKNVITYNENGEDKGLFTLHEPIIVRTKSIYDEKMDFARIVLNMLKRKIIQYKKEEIKSQDIVRFISDVEECFKGLKSSKKTSFNLDVTKGYKKGVENEKGTKNTKDN